MTILLFFPRLYRSLVRVLRRVVHKLRSRFGPKHRRLELAWSGDDRDAIERVALNASPREGAVLALSHWSTGATRDTIIVTRPIAPQTGDLSYHRGAVVTVTARYWNRAIDALIDQARGTGLAVLHSHPGEGTPQWSTDDDVADAELAHFLYGEGFLPYDAPLLSVVASHSELRGRALSLVKDTGAVSMRPVERIRTVRREQLEIGSTTDRVWPTGEPEVPKWADRSVRVFGKEGQRLLADVHVALVGAGGVGSICGDHVTRWGVGSTSIWDPDVIKDVNVSRSGVFTFADAIWRRLKARTLAAALVRSALAPNFTVRWSSRDVRDRRELPALLDADVILMLVDDARPRHFVNRIAYAHLIPTLDGGNAIRSTAEDDSDAETATVESGGVRVSHLTTGGPCLWCAGHLSAERLGLAYRPEADKAADRARGYVEHLGPEHAPSVMPANSVTAALMEFRLQDLLFGLSRRYAPELYFDLIAGTLNELPRNANPGCRHCVRYSALGDAAELPFIDWIPQRKAG